MYDLEIANEKVRKWKAESSYKRLREVKNVRSWWNHGGVWRTLSMKGRRRSSGFSVCASGLWIQVLFSSTQSHPLYTCRRSFLCGRRCRRIRRRLPYPSWSIFSRDGERRRMIGFANPLLWSLLAQSTPTQIPLAVDNDDHIFVFSLFIHELSISFLSCF